MRRYVIIFSLLLLPCTLIGGNNPLRLQSDQTYITLCADNSYPFDLSDVIVEVVTTPAWIAFDNYEAAIGNLPRYSKKEIRFNCNIFEEAAGKNGIIEIVYRDQNSNVFDYQEIEIQTEETSEHTAFIDVYPNPANPEATIQYRLNEPSELTLDIFNVLGQRIRMLYQDFQPAGVWKVNWDGKNANGEAVSSGIYFARLTIHNSEQNKRIQTATRILIQK